MLLRCSLEPGPLVTVTGPIQLKFSHGAHMKTGHRERRAKQEDNREERKRKRESFQFALVS